jgi:hypothetical protein
MSKICQGLELLYSVFSLCLMAGQARCAQDVSRYAGPDASVDQESAGFDLKSQPSSSTASPSTPVGLRGLRCRAHGAAVFAGATEHSYHSCIRGLSIFLSRLCTICRTPDMTGTCILELSARVSTIFNSMYPQEELTLLPEGDIRSARCSFCLRSDGSVVRFGSV